MRRWPACYFQFRYFHLAPAIRFGAPGAVGVPFSSHFLMRTVFRGCVAAFPFQFHAVDPPGQLFPLWGRCLVSVTVIFSAGRGACPSVFRSPQTSGITSPFRTFFQFFSSRGRDSAPFECTSVPSRPRPLLSCTYRPSFFLSPPAAPGSVVAVA